MMTTTSSRRKEEAVFLPDAVTRTALASRLTATNLVAVRQSRQVFVSSWTSRIRCFMWPPPLSPPFAPSSVVIAFLHVVLLLLSQQQYQHQHHRHRHRSSSMMRMTMTTITMQQSITFLFVHPFAFHQLHVQNHRGNSIMKNRTSRNNSEIIRLETTSSRTTTPLIKESRKTEADNDNDNNDADTADNHPQIRKQLKQQQPIMFRFAPNGVCTDPPYFVATTTQVEEAKEATTKVATATVTSSQPQHQQQRQNRTRTSKKATPIPKVFTMRNVPGDGDCIFLAVALATAAAMGLDDHHHVEQPGSGSESESGGGKNANDTDQDRTRRRLLLLREISRETRNVCARVLGDSPAGSTLHMQHQRCVTAQALLQHATNEEGFATTEDYLRALRTEGRNG